uniref:Ig-like domain-containing protein n=1 Tax=Electrophorus electricus TaxID=8005 RepID=A0AAY5ELG8_ELEEL
MLSNMYMIFLFLTQGKYINEPSLTKLEGKTVFISCKVAGLSGSDYVHWYQKKDGEPFTRILYVKADGTGLTTEPNHPDSKDFTVKTDRQSSDYQLKVYPTRKSHSGVYYCACWDTSRHSDRNYSHSVQKLAHY